MMFAKGSLPAVCRIDLSSEQLPVVRNFTDSGKSPQDQPGLHCWKGAPGFMGVQGSKSGK